jgi:hypothetical protein
VTPQRRGSGQVEVGRDLQDKALVDDYAVGIAAIRDASEVLIGEVIGEGKVRAELLETRLAFGTSAVGIHHATYRREVPGFEPGDCGAGPGDTADDLMAGDAGIHGWHDVALFRTWGRSEWQIPQNRISICTSCSVGSRRVTVVDAGGDVALPAA